MTGSPAVESRPSFRQVLHHRPFFLLWLSQLVSQSGDLVFEVALLWLVLGVTGSVFAVGIVVAVTLLPGVVLGPFLGVYVDRWGHLRRRFPALDFALFCAKEPRQAVVFWGGTSVCLG